ncbi:serine/threonine-protein phosphatase 7 long form homolog [Arachis hypogaea]|uniref:serine/threonine-protein phosphatase 7 long form homolog n=1 Tax=Arachis hypogaea TaxID=3818 RepID=UPI003B227E7F
MHDSIITYLDSAGLLYIARLNDYWFKLDEPLISEFVEQWCSEIHTFHMPFEECTVALQDVAYQFGLPVHGFQVSGCLNYFEQLMEGEAYMGVNKFRVVPADASEVTVHIYGYIIMLLFTMLFADKSGARVQLRWLPYVTDFDGLGKFPTFKHREFDTIFWPLASRYLPSSDKKGPRVIATRHRLRLSVDDFCWMSYSAPKVIQVVHPDIHRPEHTLLWKSTTALIYFVSIEWHQVNRVLYQLGGVQHIPDPAINIEPDFLLLKDSRGPTRWFPKDLFDPRQAGILVDALARGHIAMLARQQGPNFPGNCRKTTREHVGTRYSQPMARGVDDA